MSYTSMYAFDAQGEGYEYATFHNAHQSAARVWEALWAKHFPGGGFLFENENIGKIWKMFPDTSLPLWLRATLGSTFDRVFVAREDFIVLAEYFERFDREFPPGTDSSGKPASHYTDMARHLRKAYEDEAIRAIGWRQTSVSENLFRVERKCEHCGQEMEWDSHITMHIPEAWNLFSELKGQDD